MAVVTIVIAGRIAVILGRDRGGGEGQGGDEQGGGQQGGVTHG